ncbi:UNVERIFIED_CONTAM: hypothetical protein O8I53_07470 [Campylobacter lari]
MVYQKVIEQTTEFARARLTSNNPDEIVYIRTVDPIFIQFKNTVDALNNPNIKYIFNPCILFFVKTKNKKHFFIKDQSFLYDKTNKIIYQNRYISSTNTMDYLRTFYAYNVYKHFGIQIENIKLIIFEKYFNLEKEKLNFVVTEAANTSAKFVKPKKPYSKLELAALASGKIFKEEFDEITGFDFQGPRTFMTSFDFNTIFQNPTLYSEKGNELFDKKTYVDFVDAISEIMDSYFLDKPIFSKDNMFDLSNESYIG